MTEERPSIFLEKEIVSAIYQIADRCDQVVDDENILHSFYDDNTIQKLNNINNQIIQGRRGTGKTHLLRVLSRTLEKENTHPIYIDCRCLGSASAIAYSESDVASRSMHLFKDFICAIAADLNKYYAWNNYIYKDESVYNAVRESLDSFFSYSEKREIDIEETEQAEQMLSGNSSAAQSISVATTPKFNIFGEKKSGREFGVKTIFSRRKKSEETIIFPNLSQPLNIITKQTNTRIYLLIDEWVSIPYDIQPIFAEFLKRSFFCCPLITVKIAVVPNRANFIKKNNSTSIGLEAGAEITYAVDLDDLLIFDKDPRRVTRFMSELLVRHINALLPGRNLACADLSYGFDPPTAVFQLIRAAGGNARDFLHIIAKSLSKLDFSSKSDVDTKLNPVNILQAAKEWFILDKYNPLSQQQKDFYNSLHSFLVKSSTRGGFIRDKDLTNPMILDLIDARVIHIISHGHTVRILGKSPLTLITLDYGGYADQVLQGMAMELFQNDDMEKICRLPNAKQTNDIHWPYDGTRTVVSCYIDLTNKDVLDDPLFF